MCKTSVPFGNPEADQIWRGIAFLTSHFFFAFSPLLTHLNVDTYVHMCEDISLLSLSPFPALTYIHAEIYRKRFFEETPEGKHTQIN